MRRVSVTPPLVLIAFIFPAFAGLNFGYDIGSTGGAIVQLRESPGAEVLNDSPLLVGLLTSGSLFGAVVGTALSFPTAVSLGRRGELLLGSVLYLMGTLLTCLAPPGGDLLNYVFLGRGLYGIGIAFSMHAAPVYIAETSTPSTRGLLVSAKEGFIVFGIMFGFAASASVNFFAYDAAVSWRLIWSPPSAISVIILVGMFIMPESPRWLAMHEGRKRIRLPSDAASDGAVHSLAETRRALRRLRSRKVHKILCDDLAVEAELRSIQKMLVGVTCAKRCSKRLQYPTCFARTT